MRSWKWMFSYVTAATLGLWLALAVSMKFVRTAHSQTPSASAPSNGDLPPEFMSETSGTPAPASPTPATQPNTAATPTPATGAVPGTSPTPAASPTQVPAQTPAQNQPPAQTQSPPPAAEPIPQANEPESVTAPSPRLGADDYVYDPTGRRDPFQPYKTILIGLPQKPVQQPNTGGTVREQIPTDPLQRWDVERFKVIGILWEVRAPKAMIKDPDGTMYTIMKNTKIGRYNGYVAAIREGEIVVIESYDNDGKVQKETKILELGK